MARARRAGIRPACCQAYGRALMSLRKSNRQRDDQPATSMWKQLDVLIGERRRYVVALSLLSIFAAFAETGVIAILAEVAADLVVGPGKKVKHGHKVVTSGGKSTFFHIHASVPTLLYVGFGLTLLRFVLQWP